MYILYVIKLYVDDIIGTYNIYMIYSTILSGFKWPIDGQQCTKKCTKII